MDVYRKMSRLQALRVSWIGTVHGFIDWFVCSSNIMQGKLPLFSWFYCSFLATQKLACFIIFSLHKLKHLFKQVLKREWFKLLYTNAYTIPITSCKATVCLIFQTTKHNILKLIVDHFLSFVITNMHYLFSLSTTSNFQSNLYSIVIYQLLVWI